MWETKQIVKRGKTESKRKEKGWGGLMKTDVDKQIHKWIKIN